MTDMQEARRLDALYRQNILDTAPSECLDRITRMAGQIFDLPIAAISLTDRDRQWFKSKTGIAHSTIPRERAPCAQVAVSSQSVVIADLLADDCYGSSNLARQGIRFYAGAPLTTRDGFSLGALCVLGTEPRETTEREMDALHDLASMVMAQIDLAHALGRTEPLSGLPNRLQFFDDFAKIPVGQRRLGILVDLVKPDELQQLMHVMGPDRVDALVKESAHVVRLAADSANTVYHVSATHFLVIADSGIDETQFLNRLKRKCDDAARHVDSRFAASWTVGVAPFDPAVTSASDLLRMLAIASEEARQMDIRVRVFSKRRDELQQRRFRILDDFVAALQSADQLRLVFQPRIDLQTGCLKGVEALLRWTHPELGDITPGEFVPIIEQSALAKDVTAWVLDQALRQHAGWHALGLHIHLSVNISARNLCEPNFVEGVLSAAAAYGIDNEFLELELTESAIMTNGPIGRTRLQTLGASGIRIAIDDFGTGYSSLAYLQRLPANVVKIDRSFVGAIETDERARQLVRTMITLSHDLGYSVVAEGVETKGIETVLRSMGCDEVQGYLYAKPMEPEALLTWATSIGDPSLRLRTVA